MPFLQLKRSKTWHSNLDAPQKPGETLPKNDEEDSGDLDALQISFAKTDQLVEWCLTSRRYLRNIKELFNGSICLEFRVCRLLQDYVVVDIKDTKELGRFLCSNVCEFEDLGALWGTLRRNDAGQPASLKQWHTMVDEVLTLAVAKYRQLKTRWGEEERAIDLRQDPVICSILGHFFMGCLINDNMDARVMKKKCKVLAVHSGFSSAVRPLCDGTPDGVSVETRKTARIVGRHLLSMVHVENQAPPSKFKAYRRKQYAARMIQAVLGGDEDGAEVYATKVMLLFGPTVRDKEEQILKDVGEAFPLYTYISKLVRDRTNMAVNDKSLDFFARYKSTVEKLFRTLERTMKPVAWKSQAERVYCDVSGTLRDLQPMASCLREKCGLERKWNKTLNPPTHRIVWYLTGKESDSCWFPENAAGLALMAGARVACDFLVDCQVSKGSSHLEMTGLLLAAQKFNRVNDCIGIIRNATAHPAFIQAMPGVEDEWKTSMELVTNIVLEHISKLEKKRRDSRHELTPELVRACRREATSLMSALVKATSAVKEIYMREAIEADDDVEME